MCRSILEPDAAVAPDGVRLDLGAASGASVGDPRPGIQDARSAHAAQAVGPGDEGIALRAREHVRRVGELYAAGAGRSLLRNEAAAGRALEKRDGLARIDALERRGEGCRKGFDAVEVFEESR